MQSKRKLDELSQEDEFSDRLDDISNEDQFRLTDDDLLALSCLDEQTSEHYTAFSGRQSPLKKIKSQQTLGLFVPSNSINTEVPFKSSLFLKLNSQELDALKSCENQLLNANSKADLEYVLSQNPHISSWLGGIIFQTDAKPWFVTIVPGDALEILNLMLKYQVKSEIVQVMFQNNSHLNMLINHTDCFEPCMLVEYVLSRCAFEPILKLVDVLIKAVTNHEALHMMSQHCTFLLTVYQNDLMKLNSIQDIQKVIGNQLRSLENNQVSCRI